MLLVLLAPFLVSGQTLLIDTLDFKNIELRRDSMLYKKGSQVPFSGMLVRQAIKANARSDWNRKAGPDWKEKLSMERPKVSGASGSKME